MLDPMACDGRPIATLARQLNRSQRALVVQLFSTGRCAHLALLSLHNVIRGAPLHHFVDLPLRLLLDLSILGVGADVRAGERHLVREL